MADEQNKNDKAEDTRRRPCDPKRLETRLLRIRIERPFHTAPRRYWRDDSAVGGTVVIGQDGRWVLNAI